ncbi:MAG TPA: amidohydrolase [Acetobacteraceae bacterium]|nr:amidohydrolase [Acetobacteraceae bacterium]
MATLIRGATILAMDAAHGATPFTGDLLVEGNTIAAIGPDLSAPPGAALIDGRDRLVMPGLVNGHLHSGETFFRGRYERLPLELWLLYAYPLLMDPPIPRELLYLRSLLVAIESLRGGVTTICDDFFDPPVHDLDRVAAVFAAYEAIGIRANVSSGVMNLKLMDELPFAREVVPAALQAVLDAMPAVTVEEYVAHCEAVFATLHGRAGRLRFMLAPSAPQRCSPELMLACDAFARRHCVPYHTHVLETKTQAVAGRVHSGRSPIRAMHDLGILHRGTTIAHAVWVDDEDIALMGAAGCSVVHNAIANQRLGAGVAPVRQLLDAGVTIALGTDGLSSNDTARIFDVMRVAGLVHSLSGPEYGRWVGAAEILTAATIGGARSALLDDVTGSLEVGKRADLIVLDLAATNFVPLSDPVKQLVYGENGSSIVMVMVDGQVVLRDGRLTTVDEAAVLAEIRAAMPALLAAHAATEQRNRVFEPWFAEIHRRATAMDIGMDRYAGDRGAPG